MDGTPKFEPEHENIMFNLDAFDRAIFDKLPNWVQDKIKESVEWKQGQAAQAAPQAPPVQPTPPVQAAQPVAPVVQEAAPTMEDNGHEAPNFG
jgi:hypothetical protein